MKSSIGMPPDQQLENAQIRVKGRNVMVPSAAIAGIVVISTGRTPRMASVKDEEFLNGEICSVPGNVIGFLKESLFPADLFTFAQKFPDTRPKFGFWMEWDNVAVIPVKSYDDWWKNRTRSDVRSNVRRSEKRGLVVKEVEPTDEFIRGVMDIYNETPIRQGRFFWHYGKDFETIKDETLTYLDRSVFLGAFFEDRLVGFMKVVVVDKLLRCMQIVSMMKHMDKYPNNRLIAKAVELCAVKGYSHLTYGKHTYGNVTDSTLTEFKSRNGFEKVLVPRYYIPLTVWGKVLLSLRMHKGIKSLLPGRAMRVLLNARVMTTKMTAELRKAGRN